MERKETLMLAERKLMMKNRMGRLKNGMGGKRRLGGL